MLSSLWIELDTIDMAIMTVLVAVAVYLLIRYRFGQSSSVQYTPTVVPMSNGTLASNRDSSFVGRMKSEVR
jgi:hypothetical protein